MLISSLYFKIRVILTLWLPELTKTILSVGSLVVSTLEPFLFTLLQNFRKYAPNLPNPLYFVPNNLQIYLGWQLDYFPNSTVFFCLRHPLVSTQLQLWLFCCWGFGCCWDVIIMLIESQLWNNWSWYSLQESPICHIQISESESTKLKRLVTSICMTWPPTCKTPEKTVSFSCRNPIL